MQYSSTISTTVTTTSIYATQRNRLYTMFVKVMGHVLYKRFLKYRDLNWLLNIVQVMLLLHAYITKDFNGHSIALKRL